MSKEPLISVIICTYNRSESLKDTLNSLFAQHYEDSFDYEVIVVDNNSKDNTRKIVRQYEDKFNGKLRCVFEANQGLSYARNRGIQEARGEIVAFTDDDCIANENWIQSIYQAFFHLNCDAMTGRIILKFISPKPKWLTTRFYGNLAMLDYGDFGFFVDSSKHRFFGANFAIKKKILKQVDGFNVSLGKKGDKAFSKEEVDLFYKILPYSKIYYQPYSVVYHKVEPERVTKSYFRKWHFYAAQSVFAMDLNSNKYERSKKIFGIPKFFIREFLLSAFSYIKSNFNKKSKPDEVFLKELMAIRYAGLISAAYKERNKISNELKGNKHIKVLFMPNFKGNPYLSLLASALRNNKVEVEVDNYQKLFGLPSLFKTMRKHRDCNIIHLHWISPYIYKLCRGKSRFKKKIKLLFYIIDILLVKISGRKIFWTIHNKFRHGSDDIKLEKRLRKLLINFADKVIVHSNAAIEEIKREYNLKNTDSFTMVPHGNFIDIYPNKIDKQSARGQLSIDNGKRVFLYFGEIRNYKGVEDLIDEFKGKAQFNNAELLIAGRPSCVELERDIINRTKNEKNIRLFLEFIPEDKVQLLMNASDVVVFPFKEILTSGSIILAMSFGKAVIAPRKDSLVELLGLRGALFFNNNNSLSSALEQALNADLESMGNHNKEVIRQYDWNKIGNNLKVAYEQTLTNHKVNKL